MDVELINSFDIADISETEYNLYAFVIENCNAETHTKEKGMYIFITNPNARSGLGGKVWSEVERILKDKEVSYQIYFTKYQRHASRIVSEITSDGEEHTIIVLGGDGTMNEVLNGIKELSKVTLGYIPIGSSNDFARYFHHPYEPEKALAAILSPKKYAMINVGLLTYWEGERKRRFAVSAGLGFDAGICHYAVVSKLKPLLNKLHLGKLTYVGIALAQMLALKPGVMTVSLDDGEPVSYEQVYFATAMNHPYEGGGFKFCPKADPGDDVMDVTVIAGIPKLKTLFLLPTAYKGWHTVFRGVYTYTCRKAVFESAGPLPVHTDGEPVFPQRRVAAALEPDKVRLIIG